MIVLHIGAPKTGTTVLQQFLTENEAALAERGIRYVRAGRPHIAHNALPMAIAAGKAAPLFDRIAREHDAAPEAMHVVSSEIMFRALVARQMAKLLPDSLRGQLRVVCYLRRQDRYAEALYKQLAKNGLAGTDRRAFLDARLPRLRYSNILGPFADLVGAENVILRPFDRDRLVDGDIVADFAHHALGLKDLSGLARTTDRANPTLSVELSEMLGRIAHDHKINVRQIIREIAQMEDPDLFSRDDTFSLADRRRIMAHAAEDNAELARLFAGGRPLFDTSDLDDATRLAALNPSAVARRSHKGALALARAMALVARSRADAEAEPDETAPGPVPEAAPEPAPTPQPESAAPEGDQARPIWFAEIAPVLRRRGFFRALRHHSIAFVERGRDVLMVTFDNLHNAGDTRPERDPWAAKFCADRDISHLGVMAGENDWFRDAELIEALHGLRDDGFFLGWGRVILAGASMGGFAAAAFASLAPGCRVIAFSPQSTLAADLVPWETRFAPGRARDWTLPHSDAAAESRAADRVWIVLDPFERLDRMQADRFDGDNVVKLRAPGLGHKSALVLNRAGALKPVMEAAVEDRLTPVEFARLARGRRDVYLYRQVMEAHLRARGHEDRAERLRLAFRRRRRQMRRAERAEGGGEE